MVKSTLEDMVLLVYDDLLIDDCKKCQMMKEIEKNWTLKEKYKVMRESYERLKKMKLLSPRQQTIDAILKYASSRSIIAPR